MICPAYPSSALCLPSPMSARSMACKVTSGAMFGRFFRAETTCRPDNDNAGSPRWEHTFIRELSKSLVDASSAQSDTPIEQTRSCLQTAICTFEASTSAASEKADLLRNILALDLPSTMLTVLPKLEFEAQKEVMRLFHQILQYGTAPVFDYVRSHKEVLQLLIDGCGNEEVALHCHMMLRSCTIHSELVVCMLEANFATELLKLAQHQIFDISSDAFSSLHELLLTHKSVAAAHLETNFKEFFDSYNALLQTEDYVTKRQALRLLGEIILDRKFRSVMKSYVCEERYLQVLMNLLRDSSKAVQLDAFHVFKVFAASPDKRPRVHQILSRNRERLVKLLESLGKNDDEGFLEDQKAVVQALWMLEALPTGTKNNHP